MEKLPEFNAEEDIEEWLEVFECRAACVKIMSERTKIQWCRSVIGSVGRRILRDLPEGSGWTEAKEELRRFLVRGIPVQVCGRRFEGTKQEGSATGKS